MIVLFMLVISTIGILTLALGVEFLIYNYLLIKKERETVRIHKLSAIGISAMLVFPLWLLMWSGVLSFVSILVLVVNYFVLARYLKNNGFGRIQFVHERNNNDLFMNKSMTFVFWVFVFLLCCQHLVCR